ncbi:ABC transporter ATP-binding protein [Streptomyces sp. NBC_00356]|uniref:ABC transporter ATP-binding protein n=1 Tax=Streptomyces sp. NBC_00356 TaxID=2975724 RepID=UPI002E257638
MATDLPASVASVGVTISGVRKQFPKHLALDGIDLSVPAGSFTTLLGPSGCGKTTLLRILAGFETATSGSVSFGDRDVATVPPWKRDVGFVFQNYALWPQMRVSENVAYGLKLRKLPKAEIARRVHATLDQVGLAQRADAFPGQLSGGQQQRVAMARALALRPTVLLLDEPLSNLDAKMRVDMRHELLTLQREAGITAVYVTHDQEEALEMSDVVAVMNNGRIEQVGSPSDIYERPATSFVASFVGQVTLIAGRRTPTGFVPDLPSARPLAEIAERAGDVDHAPCQLALRPEDLTVVEPGHAECHWEGTLERTTYHGRGRTSSVRLADGTRCLVAHRAPLTARPGGTVGIRALGGCLVPLDRPVSPVPAQGAAAAATSPSG